MKRYFDKTLCALARGLDKLRSNLGYVDHEKEILQQSQQASTSASSQLANKNAGETFDRFEHAEHFERVEHVEHFDRFSHAHDSSDLHHFENGEASEEADEQSIVENEKLAIGIKYLQDYPAVKLQEIVSRVMAEVESGQIEEAKERDFASIDSGKAAQAQVYQTWWLSDLIGKVANQKFETEISSEQEINVAENSALASSSGIVSLSDAKMLGDVEATRKLMTLIFTTFKSLADEFNEMVGKTSDLAQLRISTTEVREVKERGSLSYLRCRASSASWSLSLRGSAGMIEIFLVPAAEIFFLSEAETSMRLKSVLRLNRLVQGDVWTIDALTADPDELFYLVRGLFKHLLVASAQDSQEEISGANILQNLEGEELRDAVQQIIFAEQNMAQKIVSQQEEIQNRIARDLHDAVIADIMSLKRLLSGDKRLGNDEVVQDLDQICTRLREICHDLAPRDLRDWGLQTVIEDLVDRLAQRTGADCSFTCNGELPELPYPVQLHIYRIVQESLNNMEKYAEATKILVRFEIDDKDIKITMRDKGKGFVMSQDGELRSKKEGGTGLSGIKERTEMIRCFFKAHLSVVSFPGEGSETILEVKT